jgi:hypothetical protein
LQQGEKQGAQQAGKTCGLRNTLNHCNDPLVARKRGTVTGIVGSVVHRLDMRKAGEIHQQGTEQAGANRQNQALR